jgi:hypothetical protein
MTNLGVRKINRQDIRRDRLVRWLPWAVIAIAGFFLLRPSITSVDLFASDEQRRDFDLRVGNYRHIPTLLLVTEWCPACKALQHRLEAQHHPYLALDIEQNSWAHELFERCIAGGAARSVPKVVYGRQMIAPQKLLSVAQK